VEPVSITRILWRQARAGDKAAYERLFSLHADRALFFIRSRLGGLREKIEPEDVLQDSYLAAHRSFEDFDYTDDGAFLRWLCRIIDNRLRDAHDYFTAKKRQEIPVPRSALTGPVTALQRVENREKIERALQQLSEEHREVLLLRYFGGLSAAETGQQMNRTAGAIRSLTVRAMVELGKHLKTVKSRVGTSEATRPDYDNT
jgi:RNA polymerase sigma-70 factor (ECF subfamily)